MKNREREEFFKANISDLYNDIYRYVRSEIGNLYWAQDVTQNTVERAWKYRYQLKKAESVKPWIFQIARNEIVRFFQGRSVECCFFDEPESELINDQHDDLEDILDVLINNERSSRIVEALQLVEPRYGQIIKLWALGDLSQKEIAQELDLNYNTVRVFLHRGLNELRNIYFALERGEGNEKER